MMQAQPSFIPLYFDEADSDIWQALQQINPEMRSAFIKEALRLMLQSYSVGETFLTPSNTKNVVQIQEDCSPLGTEGDHNEQIYMENLTDSREEELAETETLSLEALFTEANAPDLNENKVEESQGYQYMMKNIFGLEDDEAVLKVFQGLSGKQNK